MTKVICEAKKLCFIKPPFAILIILLATILAYSSIFQNGFVLDDKSFIVKWDQIRSLDNLPQLIRGDVPDIHKGVYRPLRSLLYALYYQIWGVNPFGYHLHSLIVHLLSTTLVYLIVKRLTKSNLAAFIAGLLFGLHPVHTESITYISASMEMTGVVFFLASFYLYLKGRLWLSIIFAPLAFFTYEMTLTLPILILGYEVIVKRERRIVLPYFGMALVYAFIRVFVLNITSRGEYLGYSFYHTMLIMIKVVVMYMSYIFYPVNLSYIHELVPGFESFMTVYSNIEAIRAQSLFDPAILFSLSVLLVLVVIAFKLRKKEPVVSFGMMWFFITLLPVSYIFPQGIALAEKYLYIPSLGVLLVVSLVFSNLLNTKWQKPTILVLVFITLAFLGLTFFRNKDWKNELIFWQKVASQHPQSALAHYTVAVKLGDQNDLEEAANYYQKAIDLEPRMWEAYFNLGNIYSKNGRYQEARDYYQKTLQINPKFSLAEQNLKLLEDDIRTYQSASLKFKYPSSWQVTENSSFILLNSGEFKVKIRVDKRSANLSVDEYINRQPILGELMNQGLASVPGAEQAQARIWKVGQSQVMELFLFKSGKVVSLEVSPLGSTLMPEFDKIVSSLEY